MLITKKIISLGPIKEDSLFDISQKDSALKIQRTFRRRREERKGEFEKLLEKMVVNSYDKERLTELYNQNLLSSQIILSYNHLDNGLSAREVDLFVKKIAELLSTNTGLNYFRLQGFTFIDEGVKALAKVLESNIALEEFCFSNNQITDEGVGEIAKALIKNTRLKVFSMCESQITDEGARKIAEALKTNTTLEELDLDGNKIKNKGVSEIAEALIINTGLKILSIQKSGITDEAVIEIAKALKTNTTLEELDLDGNEIKNKGARALAEMLKTNTALKRVELGLIEIEVSKNDISQELEDKIESYIRRNNVLDAMQKKDEELLSRLLKNISQKEINSWIKEKNEIKEELEISLKELGIKDTSSLEMRCLSEIIKEKDAEERLKSINYSGLEEEVKKLIRLVKELEQIKTLDMLDRLMPAEVSE